MGIISSELIQKMWPHATPEIQSAIVNGDVWMEKVGINTPLVVSHFLAQISLECGAGTEMVENLNYREEALRAQWPSHFSPQQAHAMAHQPALIANQAYNGRMGNVIGSNDGWNYRGRGFCQTTGREAYTNLAALTGIDLVNHPELVNDPQYVMEISTKDFAQCGCIQYALRDDVVNVTKHLNGGLIGLSQREAWLSRWKAVL